MAILASSDSHDKDNKPLRSILFNVAVLDLFLAILGDSDDDENKPLQNRRRGGGGRSKQSRTSISNQEPVAAFPQPPKERPDARHHLKVFI